MSTRLTDVQCAVIERLLAERGFRSTECYPTGDLTKKSGGAYWSFIYPKDVSGPYDVIRELAEQGDPACQAFMVVRTARKLLGL